MESRQGEGSGRPAAAGPRLTWRVDGRGARICGADPSVRGRRPRRPGGLISAPASWRRL